MGRLTVMYFIHIGNFLRKEIKIRSLYGCVFDYLQFVECKLRMLNEIIFNFQKCFQDAATAWINDSILVLLCALAYYLFIILSLLQHFIISVDSFICQLLRLMSIELSNIGEKYFNIQHNGYNKVLVQIHFIENYSILYIETTMPRN